MPYKRLNIPTFNQQSIDNWHIGVTTLPDKIAQENLRLQESTLRLLQAQHQLKELQTSSIRSVETTILGLSSRINVLTLPAVIQQKKDFLAELQAESARLRQAIQRLEDDLTPVNDKIKKLTCLIDIKVFEPQIEGLKNRLKIIRESAQSLRQQLQTVDQQSMAVSSQLSEASERLSRLRHQQSLDAMGHAMQDRYRHPSHHHHHHNNNGIGNLIHVVGDVARDMAIASEQASVNRLQSE